MLNSIRMESNPYKLNSGMMCVKYMLLIINFMFLLTSILLILVGTTIQTIYGDFKNFLDDHFLSPPALLVAVGAIMLIVASFGCIGALKESTLLTNVYGLFLLVIFVLEIAAAISAYALQGQVRAMLIRTMNESIQNYEQNRYARKSVDFMQSALECCGVDGARDYEYIAAPVPQSCCAYFPANQTETNCLEPYSFGCLNRMDYLISQSTMLIATGATTVAFVQILGVICAFMLAKTIRRTKTMRAVRKWQLQQSLGIFANGGKDINEHGYTQLDKADKTNEPVTYTTNSPSVN